MKIRIMKREVLDKIKDNIEEYIENYYTQESNDWLWNVCDCEPFEDYKVVKEFELANLNQAPTMIDFYNCQILYSNLEFLNESQASDERLWAGLTNDVFYDYMRKRFNMNKESYKNSKNPVGEVVSRFFYKNSGRSGYFRNTLAKCWWVGHHTYDPIKKFELLEKLGSHDMSTKVTDIFHNYTFTSNREILTGIIEGIYYFNKNGIKFNMIKHARPCLQYINAIGGSTVLDIYSSDEIRDIFIEHMNVVLNEEEEDYSDFDEFDNIEEETNDIDEDAIKVGDKVKILNLSTNLESIFVIKYSSDYKMLPIPELLLGKHINDEFDYEDSRFRIVEII
ncbi:MAG: hypothetical protein IJS83_00160 [Acholeplasmatales bacterium]|nr:hypothetical protein [Acholeplasmatales bacterium]